MRVRGRDGAADPEHGPLPGILIILTIVTGVVDAVSYLRLGHVFVANMTGNVVFFGFGLAGATDVNVLASLAAIIAFIVGAFAGGRLGATYGGHRGRLVMIASLIKLACVGAATIVAAVLAIDEGSRYALIGLLAFAMGLQNAVARRIAVPDLTTTVLTMTVTGLAADLKIAGGKGPNPSRRLASAFLNADRRAHRRAARAARERGGCARICLRVARRFGVHQLERIARRARTVGRRAMTGV